MLHLSMLGQSSRQHASEDSLRGDAYRRIKEMIITLEIPAASFVQPDELADTIGLGLTPVRQALQLLSLEDLVVIVPRRGTIVADINGDDMEKIYELRVELEPYAAQLAARRATSDQVAQLKRLSHQMSDLAESGQRHAMLRVDLQAHRILADATHNEFLADILERLYGHALRLWYLCLERYDNLPLSVDQYQEIVSAIEVGDEESAISLMHAYIASFHDIMMSAIPGQELIPESELV